MKDKLSRLKMRIYCFVVNRNTYVRDAYQLPIDLNLEYHQKHRLKELFRLSKLLLKYRILHMKPPEEELFNLKEMQEKKVQMLNSQTGITSAQKDDASIIRETVTGAINEIKEADLIRFSKRENIIIWGNGSGSNIPQLVRKITGSSDEYVKKYHFIWLRNKKKTDETPTFTTFYYPWVLMVESGYPEKTSLSLTDDESKNLSRYTFLQQSADLILSECPLMADTYAKLISHEMFRYFSAVLEYLNPRLVLVWNESAWFSLVSKICCDEIGIPYAMLELECFQYSVHTDEDIMYGQPIGKMIEYLEAVISKTDLF